MTNMGRNGSTTGGSVVEATSLVPPSVRRASQVVSARLADVATAQYLDVSVGAPLLSVQRIVREMSGRPVQLLQGLYRPDRYEYRMELSRVGEDRARLWIDNAGHDVQGGHSEDVEEAPTSAASPASQRA